METLTFSHLADNPSGLGVGLAAAGATAGAYALYRHLLPKPIPGIPYNPEAAASLLGDLPAMAKASESGSGVEWIIDQARRHPGPLCQVFIQPLGKPFLLLSDFREAQDIFLRRSHEFDRSDWSIELLGGAAPTHHINMKTGPAWKAHRRLLQDLMTPAFLNNVAAPNIYNSVQNLVQLWGIKAKWADGRSFSALDDIYDAAMDAVLEFSFGSAFSHRAVLPQLELLRGPDVAFPPLNAGHKTVVFPRASVHESIKATYEVSKDIGDVMVWPRPRLGWHAKKFQSAPQTASRARHEYVKEQVDKGVGRLQARERDGNEGEDWVKSAVDLMLDRETRFAAKEGRDPVYWSATMRDEVLGFVIAGHDTTSTSMLWGLKFLSASQDVQTKLREALQGTHVEANQESREPTAAEITTASIPYLEAVIEEILRLAGTLPVLERQCNRDTTLLGHFVPKGTTVLMLGLGPSITEPARDVDEVIRSDSSRTTAKERGVRSWDPTDMAAFRPERWLNTVDGKEVFDSTAGPMLAFGNGIRGCFGRRLAYLEMRLMITLLVWNFALQETPKALSGFEGTDELTRKPKDCYVRLKSIGRPSI